MASADVDVRFTGCILHHISQNLSSIITGQFTKIGACFQKTDCSALLAGGGAFVADGDVAHVLLWFAVVAFDVTKMTYASPSVYREK